MKSTVWMSYDLGVVGDYESLYAWLDDHNARECGNSVAWFSFSHEGDALEYLKAEIENAVSLGKRSRIYVICLDDESTKGRFIIGGRKGAPWDGFGMHEADSDDLASYSSSISASLGPPSGISTNPSSDLAPTLHGFFREGVRRL